MNPTALVAGIGNMFLGDDAFGCVVARQMMLRYYLPEVRVVDFGIRGFDLVFALLEKFEIVILVDALPHAGPPGSLRVQEIPVHDGESTLEAMPNTHGVTPARVFEMARHFGIRAQKIFLVGCVPETLEPNENGEFVLTAPVASAVEPAIKLVDELLARTLSQHRPAIIYA